jgi:hypothetical protein
LKASSLPAEEKDDAYNPCRRGNSRRDLASFLHRGHGIRRSNPQHQGENGSERPTRSSPASPRIGRRTAERSKDPALFEKDLVIEVTAQEGRRFWGMQTFTGNGENTQEPMIGELTGKDNKTVVIVDRDGYLDGQLIDDNTLSFCYKQAGGQIGASVVSCSEIKRTP